MAVALDNPESLADLSTLVERTVPFPLPVTPFLITDDPVAAGYREVLSQVGLSAVQDSTAALGAGLLRGLSAGPRQSLRADRKFALHSRNMHQWIQSIYAVALFAFDTLHFFHLTSGTSPADVSQFIAKAFLEKDYDAIKARETAPLAQDVAMGDVDQKEAVTTQPLEEPAKTEAESAPVKVEENPTESLDQAAPAVPPESQPSEDVAVKAEQKPETAEPADQSLAEGTDGINFDSMLNDAGGSNSFNLSLDFGDDDMGNQAFLSGSGLGTSAPSGLDQPATSQPADNNTATAIPAGGGAFDMELQKSEDPNGFPDQSMDDLMGPGESNFDDLFLETDNLGGEEAGNVNSMEGDSLMNLDELNDDWFN